MDPKSYWEDRIDSLQRHRSIGNISYPESVNRYAKEAAKDPIEKALTEHDIDLRGQRVLDAGCGTGIYSEFYVEEGAQVTGFDVSSSAIEQVRERGIPGDFSVQQLPEISYEDDTFDFTHCFSVLYHILDDEDWRRSLEQLHRVTKEDGHLLLRIEWTSEPDPPSDHYKQRSKENYRDVFDELGFEVRDSYSVTDVPRYPRLARYLPWLVNGFDMYEKNPSNRILLLQAE